MPSIADWCDQLTADRWIPPSDIDAVTVELLALGWRAREWGEAADGTPIRTLSFGSGDRVVAAYGYPHPDEPIGATALVAFARTVAEHGVPLPVQFDICLCADPVGARENDGWIRSPTVATYLTGDWHPHYLGLEVDYAFPIDWGPFLQPPHFVPASGKAPLPESLALAAWLDARRPAALGLMHNEHVSGAYTFMLRRPSRALVTAFDEINARWRVPVHRGERPDPGERWVKARTDLLKERSLAHRERQLRRLVGEIGDQRWLTGCASVTQYLESLEPECEVITPEVGMWYPPGIDDVSPSELKRRVVVSREETRRGRRIISRGELVRPDGSLSTVCYAIEPDDPSRTLGEMIVPLTRGMLGVEAVEDRRWWLGRADELWAVARPRLVDDTPRRRDRETISVPAHLVQDRAMLIFRTAEQYRRPAAVAHVADFEGRWRFHTARQLGWGVQLYREAGLPEAVAQEALLDRCRDRLPRLRSIGPTPAARSLIARWLLAADENL